MVGEWSCSPGSFDYTYPSDEFRTLVEGKGLIKCEDGKMHDYQAGDT